VLERWGAGLRVAEWVDSGDWVIGRLGCVWEGCVQGDLVVG
jgi:hypothetical protein